MNSLSVYMSIDKNILANDYVNPKWSDDVKEKLRETALKSEQLEKEKEQSLNAFQQAAAAPYSFVRRNHVRSRDSPIGLALVQLHKDQGFIEALSMSNSIGSRGGYSMRRRRGRFYQEEEDEDNEDDEISDYNSLTLTLYDDEISPLLRTIVVSGEIIQQIILRFYGYENEKRVIEVIEYELGYAKITNASLSGGSGGIPVQSLSIDPMILTTTLVTFEVDSGLVTKYSTGTLDFKFKDRCKRMILPIDPTNPIIFDERNEESLQILKDRHVEYTSADKGAKEKTIKIYVQYGTDELPLKRKLNITRGITLDDLTKKVSQLLSKEIKSLMDCDTQLDDPSTLEANTVITPIYA